jgi:hypothetical protein
MDTFTSTNLRELLTDHAPPCVSVYLPTHPAGSEGQQDPVRLKNLLNQAEQELAAGWMRATEARDLLQKARDLPADPTYWDARSRGLAIFVSPDTFEPYRLPLTFQESVTVDERFVIRPLLPLLNANERFFVLALSQNKVRLFEADRHHIKRVEVPNLPPDMEEALDYVPVDRGSQTHSAMQGARGKQAAVFHGQGGKAEAHKDDLHQFFRLVDAALRPRLRDERVPLVLAGVEYLPPIYREVTSYPHVCDPALYGNCDYLTEHELHERVWPVAEPVLSAQRCETAQRIRHALDSADGATDDLKKILTAAHAGRVDTFFVRDGAQEWGEFFEAIGRCERHDQRQPGDRDLLEMAATATLLHHGTVYAVGKDEMPTSKAAAARLRY